MTTFLEGLSKLPLGTIAILALVLPWLVLLVISWLNQRMIREFRDQFWEETKESRERFEAVVRMYEDNVVLVKNYEKLATDQQDLIISNTTTVQRLLDRMERRP
jgi:hypothetical protein